MRTRKETAKTERTDALDLLPRAEGMKRADELLRRMLSSPPDPHTPPHKPEKKKRTK